MNDLSPDVRSLTPASLRDSASRLFFLHGRLIRAIQKSWVATVRAFLNSRVAHEFTRSGRLAGTPVLNGAATE